MCSGMMRQTAREAEASLLIMDAARRLGVSRRTVYYRISEGRLRTIRTRGGSQRVLASSIEELLGNHASHAQALALQVQPFP